MKDNQAKNKVMICNNYFCAIGYVWLVIWNKVQKKIYVA